MVTQEKQIPHTIICLMGPTASGKTEIALHLATLFPCEIISVDSALIYCGMDIGTAKPGRAILKKFPHHLIDIRDPSEHYSAADFRKDALDAIESILQRKKIPLLVGGTMLYFKTLLEGISSLPSADSSVRLELQKIADEKGWHYLHQELEKVDPASAQRIHPNDPQRIQRALEVHQLTGKSLTELWQSEHKQALPYHVICLAIQPKERKILHQQIADRFEAMLEQGLTEEVRRLFERGDLDQTFSSIRSVNYRQVWEYLSGEIDYETMKQKAVVATRQLAKRQLTWLRHWPNLQWFSADDCDGIERYLMQEGIQHES